MDPTETLIDWSDRDHQNGGDTLADVAVSRMKSIREVPMIRLALKGKSDHRTRLWVFTQRKLRKKLDTTLPKTRFASGESKLTVHALTNQRFAYPPISTWSKY